MVKTLHYWRLNYLATNLLLAICCFTTALSAQQEQEFTQFFNYKTWYNPATAGANASPEIIAAYRKQMLGFDDGTGKSGIPEAQLLSFNQRILKQRVGVGGNLTRTGIGITRTITLDIAYAYRLTFRRSTFSVGFMPSIRHYSQNWADPRVNPADKFDPLIPTDTRSRVLGNLGVGAYFTANDNHWYAGLSAPRIIGNKIGLTGVGGEKAREVLHLIAMGGATFSPSDELQVTPQALLRYVPYAPFDADLNVMMNFKKKFDAGITYRTGGNTKGLGESVDILFGIQTTKHLYLGLSYDITMSRLRSVSNGSIELGLRWRIRPEEGDTVDTPF